ncbi:MAG: hypothetical protein SGILL_010493, partial [Bacillariaceae sp.]
VPLNRPSGASQEPNSSMSSDVTFDEEEVESTLSSLYSDDEDPDSFHLGRSRVSVANVFTSVRRTPSFEKYGEEYQLVPSKLKQNVKLVTDPNLSDREKGRLYYARYSIYNNQHEPKYALTVQPMIYKEIIMEVNDAYSVPCGMYFCCHGGDGAHTGVSHDDYVDIKLAWAVLIAVFAVIVCMSIALPWPDADYQFDDDFYDHTATGTGH